MDHCLALDSNWTAHSGVRRNYQYHVPCSKQLIHLTWPSELVAPEVAAWLQTGSTLTVLRE